MDGKLMLNSVVDLTSCQASSDMQHLFLLLKMVYQFTRTMDEDEQNFVKMTLAKVFEIQTMTSTRCSKDRQNLSEFN